MLNVFALIKLSTLNDVEAAGLKAFLAKHRASCPALGMSPGLFAYTFTPTTIATFIEVTCTHCSAKENITDVESI